MCEQLTAEQVKANTIKTLGFDPEYNKLTLQSVLAASLRRAAGLLCPCPRQDLIRSVIKPLEHADTTNTFSIYNEVIDTDGLKELAEETLYDLITYSHGILTLINYLTVIQQTPKAELKAEHHNECSVT